VTRTFPHRLLLLVVAALMALAVHRVDAAPGPPPPYGGYTWESALDELRLEAGATVDGLRREALAAKAAIEQMRADVRELQVRLGSIGSS
jgi:hypothetical protein